MRYQLVIAGKPGPTSRDEAIEAIKFFFTAYGVEPTAMTVMAAGVEHLVAGCRLGKVDGDLLTATLNDGRSAQFFGLTLTLGTQYTVSA